MAGLFGARMKGAYPMIQMQAPQPSKALVSAIPLAPGVTSATTDPSQSVAPAASSPTWKKPSTLQTIAGIIGDSLAQWQGGQPLFAQSNMLRQKAIYDAAMAQQERANKFTDWQQQYDYQLAHPKPNNNDTVDDYNFIASTLGPDKAREYLSNVAAGQPIVVRNPDGTITPVSRGEFANPPAPQPAPPGVTFTPLPATGGATPAGSRPFP